MDAKVRLKVSEIEIQLEGSEAFVSKYLDIFNAKFANIDFAEVLAERDNTNPAPPDTADSV